MEYDYSAFESKTGIRVVIHDSILDDGISADMRRNLESGRNTSWFDRDSLAIHIYTGYYSKRPEPENIYANIIYQALSFFPPSRLLNKEHKGLSLPRTDTATGYLTLMEMVNRDSVYLDRLSSALSSALGFPGGGKFSDAVRAGVTQAAKHAERQAIEKGDPAYFASKIRSALENPYSCRSVRAGTVSDPMRAVDYPAGLPVYLNVERLYSVWKASGMDIMPFSFAVARGISNPAAILERDKPKQNGDYEYCIIADSILPDGVLAISVSHPRKTLSEVIANRENKPRGISGFPVTLKPAWMNRMLEHALDNQQKGNPAKGWLRSEDKWFGKEYTLLDIIKSETSKATVTSSALFAWSLKTATNIRNNFLNPKIPDADYSPVLNEMERRDRIDELIRAADPVGMSVTPPSETERRKQKLRTSSLSAKAVSVLREQDALTVEGVIRLGPDKLCSLTNQATVKKVEKALQEAGFSLYNRRRAISEKDFTILSEQTKDREILNDFRESLRFAPEGLFRNLELRTPVRLDGKPVPPEGAVHLIVKSSSLGSRWSSSPLFLTASELEGMGAEPLPTASVTHVRTEDGFVSLYNVHETNLESKFPALYELVTSHAEKASKPLSPYMKVALNQVVRKDLSAEMAGQASDILVRFWRKDVPEFSIRKDVPHIKESTGSERDGAVAGNPSSVGLSESRQGTPKPSFHNSALDAANLTKKTEILKRKVQKFKNEHDIPLRRKDEDGIVSAIGEYFNLERSRSSHSFYGDYYEGDFTTGYGQTVRVRLSQHPASRDRVAQTPTEDFVSIVVYKNGGTTGKAGKPYVETTYHLSEMSPEMIVESIGEGMGRILKDGLFFDKFGVFDTFLHEGNKTSVLAPEFATSSVLDGSSTPPSPSEVLATRATMFLAGKLEDVGIRVEQVDSETALAAYQSQRDAADFSAAEMERLTYEWEGDDISLKTFVDTFRGEIKQKDRTLEDAERIAKTYIDAVKASPERFIPQLKAENMSHARYFILSDGSVWTPEHPMASSPEYGTQRELYAIYERVLGTERHSRFNALLSASRSRTPDENREFSDMEREVNASKLMQGSLESNAESVNKERIRSVSSLIQYLEVSDDYTLPEKAVILKGAMTWGLTEKKHDGQTERVVSRITDSNTLGVPVVGGTAAAIAEGLRKGYSFKDSLKDAYERMSEETTRSVSSNFTGWKVYKRSDSEEDASVLLRDAAGTGWCTGTALSTAHSHLSRGDFHIYFESGEPLIAIRTNLGSLAEPPRGAHDGQFCTEREEQIAFQYIKSGNGIVGGEDYISDMENLRHLNSDKATWQDALYFPRKRSYANGEFGGDTKSWGEGVQRRILALLETHAEERHEAGVFSAEEIHADPSLAPVARMIYSFGGTYTLVGDFSYLEILYGIKNGTIIIDSREPLHLSEINGLGAIKSKNALFVNDIRNVDTVSAPLVHSTHVFEVGTIISSDLKVEEAADIRYVNIKENGKGEITKATGPLPGIKVCSGGSITMPSARGTTVILDESSCIDVKDGYIHELYLNGKDFSVGATHVFRLEYNGQSVSQLPEAEEPVDLSELHITECSVIDGVVVLGNGIKSVILNPVRPGSPCMVKTEHPVNLQVNCPRRTIDLNGLNVLNLRVGHNTSVTGIETCSTLSLEDGSHADSIISVGIPGETDISNGEIQIEGMCSLASLQEAVSIHLFDSKQPVKLPVREVESISVTRSSVITPNVEHVKNVKVYNGHLSGPVSADRLEIEINGHADTIRFADDITLRTSSSSADSLQQAGKVTLLNGARLDGLVRCKSLSVEGGSYCPPLLRQVGDTEIFQFRLSDGKVFGYQIADTIYLTKDGINPNTPIHEYAHMWAKVFQQTSPESWKSIKDELKATPLWSAVSGSSEYSYIDGDEDRLAGEVLATMVGDKGEELMLLAAGETLKEEPKKSRQLKTTVSKFRQRVTDMAAEDVFKMPELKNTGELTLYLLQDFANGRLMAHNTAERFSSDYERHKAGKMESHEVYEFGMPGLILRAAGVSPYPIRMSQKVLDEHIQKHNLPESVVLSLPESMQKPIMVYTWGKDVLSKTIITELDVNGQKLTFAIQSKNIDGFNYINDIRTVHLKEVQRMVEEINDPKDSFKDDLCWVNKEKVLAWFSGTEALTSSIGYKQELISAAKVINDFDNPKLFSQNAEFSIQKSTDMRHTPQTAVYDNPEWFSLMQLQGARSRVSALLNILTGGSLLIFEDVLAIHKEMAAEGLLNQFSAPTPGKGLFRADSIQELDLKSIFMGRTGGANSASLWDITVNTDPSVPEEDGKYNTALNQYIHTLTYSLTRTKDLLDKAIEEAKDEREDVMATRQKKGLKEKVVDGALKLYSFIWGETKTKYPLDPPSRMSIYKEDQEMAYLNRIGITSDALSIVMNGMEYGHEGRMDTLVSRPSVPVLSRGDIIAPIEATMRRVLLSAAGLADDKGVVHLSNKLPVIYPNGQAFIGTSQSILRLAMETEHLSIPVVVDNELMNQLGIEPVGEPLSLGLGQSDGAMVKKEFWFLEQTDFKDVYPTHFDGLSVQFSALNAERTAKGSEIMASFPHVPSVFDWAGRTLNPIQMAMFDIALETSLGYCDSVSLPVTNENVERLSMQDLTVLSVQYNSGEADRDFLYQEAAKVDGIIQDSAKEVFAGREPERGFDFESMLSRADKGKDAAEGYEYAGAEAVEETGQAEENEASLQESAEAEYSF